MAVRVQEIVDPWRGRAVERVSTEGHKEGEAESARTVIDRVNEILGYDVLEVAKMAHGYLEQGPEALILAESNLAAAYEALPPEE
jgi:hypothetical protein